MSNFSVNGLDIESDRPIASADRTFITYADGSTFDATTGAYHSAGPGYIKVNGQYVEPTTASDNVAPEEVPQVPPTEGASESYSFLAKRLVIRTSIFSVTVVAHDRPDIVVELDGTARMIEMVGMAMTGDALEVTETRAQGARASYSSGSTTVTMFASGSMVSVNGVLVSGLSENPGDSLTIMIRVPYGTPIDAHTKSISNIDIVDVDGPLKLKVSSAGSIKASNVSGDVIAETNSMGNIDITRGNIPCLEAVSSSSGSIRVTECTIARADATVKSMGDIRITDGNVGHLNAVTSNMGSVTLSGTAATADLRVNSMGNIYVTRVLATPSKRINGMGSIKIGRIG